LNITWRYSGGGRGVVGSNDRITVSKDPAGRTFPKDGDTCVQVAVGGDPWLGASEGHSENKMHLIIVKLIIYIASFNALIIYDLIKGGNCSIMLLCYK